jgi:hypothetical protein
MKGVIAGMVSDDDDTVFVRDTAEGRLILRVRTADAVLTADEADLLADQIKDAVDRAREKVA